MKWIMNVLISFNSFISIPTKIYDWSVTYQSYYDMNFILKFGIE